MFIVSSQYNTSYLRTLRSFITDTNYDKKRKSKYTEYCAISVNLIGSTLFYTITVKLQSIFVLRRPRYYGHFDIPGSKEITKMTLLLNGHSLMRACNYGSEGVRYNKSFG